MTSIVLMRISSLQLKHLLFTRVFVEPEVPFQEASSFKTGEFSFEGVTFHVNLNTAAVQGQEDDPRDFMIELNVGITNEKNVHAPYKIDIGVLGLFEISEKIEKDERVNIVTVNGSSLLYGAIREQVSTITSRSYLGTMVLPTMDFRDHIQGNQTIEEKAEKKPEKKAEKKAVEEKILNN